MSKVSIIVPVFNGENYIVECVENIKNQTFHDFELILINDGSTDETDKLCKTISEDDKRVKYISKQNGGTWTTRNLGIENATGKYILFLDCDDYYDNRLLEKMHDSIEKNDLDLVICGQIDVVKQKDGVIENKALPERKYYNNNKKFLNDYIYIRSKGIAETIWNKIYKTEIIKNNNIRFQNLKRGEDVIFNLDYFKFVNRCETIPETLYYYRIDGTKPWWIKYSDDLYNIILTETLEIIKRLKSYNNYGDKEVIAISTSFIENIICYMLVFFYPERELTFKEKKNNICKIINELEVREALKTCEANSIFSKYAIKFIKSKNTIMLILLYRLYIIVKRIY